MKISELSKITGASTRSIRHYEKKKLITTARLENDYREFDESAVERIRIIQLYLGLGLTTEQIENILDARIVRLTITSFVRKCSKYIKTS